MRKIYISIAIILIAVLFIAWFISDRVETKVTERQSQDAVATSEANAKDSKEAKEGGEAATTRADLSKSAVREKATATKERIREDFTPLDDQPLSAELVNELCRAYSYTDCVHTTSTESTPANKD